jgi:hypothetical protein
LYNALALPALLYGSEDWNIKVRDATRIGTAEVKYRRKTAGYTWTDNKTNTQFAKEVSVTPDLDKIQEYRRNWLK